MGVSYEKSLKGITVLDAAGRVIGKVKDVTVDSTDWRLVNVRVELRSEVAEMLGTEHSYFHPAEIDLPREVLQNVTDALILKVSVGELRTEVHHDQPPPTEPAHS